GREWPPVRQAHRNVRVHVQPERAETRFKLYEVRACWISRFNWRKYKDQIDLKSITLSGLVLAILLLESLSMSALALLRQASEPFAFAPQAPSVGVTLRIGAGTDRPAAAKIFAGDAGHLGRTREVEDDLSAFLRRLGSQRHGQPHHKPE